MTLIKFDKISLAYGHVPLLDKVDFQLEAGERVCLVGRNGTGKSTLMRIIQGAVQADDGQVWKKPGLRIAHLAQEVPLDEQQTVFDVVTAGLAQIGRLLSEYHHALQSLGDSPDAAAMESLSRLQQALEVEDGWRLEQRVEEVISRLQLPADSLMSTLSGGLKRRVMLAQALVTEPDLLLLDEPTNHLDLAGIQWLEDFLQSWDGSLLFITHDRAFLQRLATRIIELDRGQLTSWPGDYQTYLRKKEEQLAVEAEQNARFDKKLAQEEIWIRQGIKARRTRNEGRVRALQALRRERAQRRDLQGTARLNLDRGELSGKIVVDVKDATVAYGEHTVIRDFSTRILRGDRVGIIGPNGVGKTTLLKLLLGELVPQQGTVELGTRLQVAYFDQQRAQLDREKSVMDNLNYGSEMVSVNGRQRHVMGYLQDFLFPPERVRSPVSSLSGGERNRLLLARLFTQPANLLVMDEPTNDLDVETLELLEELLNDYDGTLLLVSHDRVFLDNVVTSTLVFEGEGRIGEYVGGYQDWLRQRAGSETSPSTEPPTDKPVVKQGTAKTAESSSRSRKLSYKEQQELEKLPDMISRLEHEQSDLQQRVGSADFYRQDKEQISATLKRLDELQSELESCFERWERLEG